MGRPLLLLVGAGVVAAEGVGLLIYAVLEVAHVTSSQVGLAVTTAVFFALVGAALLVCARGLWRAISWARSPAVVAQLITLLTGWSFRGGDTTAVAVALIAVSATALVCLLHPRTTEALVTEQD